MHRSSTPRSGSMVLTAGLGLTVLALAACGGGSSSGGTSPTSPASRSGAGPAAGANAPAASGLIADVSGSTMQVQSQQNGQVAVSWSAATSFTDTVSIATSAIKVGDCVFAIGPSGSSVSATTFTAVTLSVSPPVNGACGGAAGRGRGDGGQGQGTGAPRSGFPGGGARPSGAPGGGPGGAVASGSVTSVSGSTIVIASRVGGTTPTSRTVTVGVSTTITTRAKATSTAAKVGKCVTVQGKADSSGKVAATTVRITNPVNGQCGARFGAGANSG